SENRLPISMPPVEQAASNSVIAATHRSRNGTGTNGRRASDLNAMTAELTCPLAVPPMQLNVPPGVAQPPRYSWSPNAANLGPSDLRQKLSCPHRPQQTLPAQRHPARRRPFTSPPPPSRPRVWRRVSIWLPPQSATWPTSPCAPLPPWRAPTMCF